MTRDPLGDRFAEVWRHERESESGEFGGVIPYRNGKALAACYCGVLGLPFCFLGLGIFGVVLGVLGLQAAAYSSRTGGRVHAWVGIVLGIIEVLSSCVLFGFLLYVLASLKSP